jgi:DNA-binding transcriptional LysR family regulator
MELYQLRTFLTVAEEGHLTRAAEKLHASQPAVSAQLRTLEEECGVKLFERTARGMTLTSAGQSLSEKARLIIEAAQNFKHHADNLRETVSGEMVLGINNIPEVLRLVPILQVLTDRHPDLRYQLITGSSGVVIQGLAEGSVSIGFFEGACNNPRIAHETLEEIELRIVAPRIWAGEFRDCDWKALETRPWVFVSPTCSYYRAIETLCHEQGLTLKPRFEVNECLTVLNFVAEGLGLTIASRRVLEQCPERNRLFCLPHFHMTLPLRFGYLAARADDPAIRAVRDAIQEVWSRPEHPPLTPSVNRPPLPRSRLTHHR